MIGDYAKLFAFEEVVEKLSREYEADLTHHITDRLKRLREFMEQNNEAIQQATNADSNESKNTYSLFRCKDILHAEGGLIDIDAVKPDRKSIEEHEKKFCFFIIIKFVHIKRG